MNHKIIRAISLDNIYNESFGPVEFDLIISGGGFYGFFVIGIDIILKKLEKLKKIRINRFSGSSVGAICSILMCCDIDSLKVLNLYDRLNGRNDFFFILKQELLKILPDDAYKTCSDRVFIHATEIGFFKFKHTVFSKYTSNLDLIDACMASSNCPFIISPKLFYNYRNKWYIDGCLSRFLPYFKNENANQLLIKLYRINYFLPYVYKPLDPSIEGLVVKGAIETEKFLNGRKDIKTMEWFNDKVKRRSYPKFFIFGSIIFILFIKYKR